jgi:hypothetical protein
VRFAASLSPDLLRRLERIDDDRLPIAEVARRLCSEAESAGEVRPSYERVRQLVRELRLEHRDTGPGRARLTLELTTGLRSHDSFSRELDKAEERAALKRERQARWRNAKHRGSK